MHTPNSDINKIKSTDLKFDSVKQHDNLKPSYDSASAKDPSPSLSKRLRQPQQTGIKVVARIRPPNKAEEVIHELNFSHF